MKKTLRKFLPPWFILSYHYVNAYIAAIRYGFPSTKMVIIGVTGTKGKTSTANFIWSVLNHNGIKTGIITTANIKIGNEEIANSFHMTMPSSFIIQKYLRTMLDRGCKYALVETTSEGLKQFRNNGLFYDIAVFTNITPEHLPSHGGSFEKYKKAKAKMFESLGIYNKTIDGKKVPKVIIANVDNKEGDYFLTFNAEKKITFGLKNNANYEAKNIRENHNGVKFEVRNFEFSLNILGAFNIYNALPAIIIGELVGISRNDIAKGLNSLKIIPGRMEMINEGQKFTVIVDYAHERESMTVAVNAARNINPNGKVIVVLGSEGGGRDKNRRSGMGEVVGKNADYCIVTNVDPYEDDPKEIIRDIVKVAEAQGKVEGKDLFSIEDRREGIKKAFSLAKEGDVVLITGKGAEQTMIIGGKTISWNEREIVREELRKFIN